MQQQQQIQQQQEIKQQQEMQRKQQKEQIQQQLMQQQQQQIKQQQLHQQPVYQQQKYQHQQHCLNSTTASVNSQSNAGSISDEIKNKGIDHVKKSPSVPKRTSSLSNAQAETDPDKSSSKFSTKTFSAYPLLHIPEQHTSTTSEACNQRITQTVRKKKAPVPIPKAKSQPPEGNCYNSRIHSYVHTSTTVKLAQKLT